MVVDSINCAIYEAETDEKIIEDLFFLSLYSYKLYRKAAKEADSQVLRNLFSTLAKISAETVDELGGYISPRDVKSVNLTHTVEYLRTWFNTAEREVKDFDSYHFLDELTEMQSRSLVFMRIGIQSMDDRFLANALSSNAAALQIVHDRARQLRNKWRKY